MDVDAGTLFLKSEHSVLDGTPVVMNGPIGWVVVGVVKNRDSLNLIEAVRVTPEMVAWIEVERFAVMRDEQAR